MTSKKPAKTAGGAKPFDLSVWEESLRREYEERERERRATLKRAETLLTEYFKKKKVREVFLVGSILEEGKFYPFSDIDVLVEGLQADFFETVTQLEGLLARTVDLLEAERCRFRPSLKQTGRKLL